MFDRFDVAGRRLLASVALVGVLALAGCGGGGGDNVQLQGSVRSGNVGLAGFTVSLYANEVDRPGGWQFLASGTTDTAGDFRIFYRPPTGRAILVTQAERGPVLLASAIGYGDDAPARVVVNERTTVATANAFAQFVRGREIDGNAVGVYNAVRMAGNLADPVTGDAGAVVARTPNGDETTTYATFNSLANAVAACVARDQACLDLFATARAPGGAAPDNVLQAMANIVKAPSFFGNARDPVFDLSLANPKYQPALAARPTNWLLFLKITGGFYSAQDSSNLMNGPGNFAIDESGYVYFDTNYIPEPLGTPACASNRAIKLTPWGANAPNSPFLDGGLSGSGYGVAFDPSHRLWIGNFGFQDPPCVNTPMAATKNSVSVFTRDGAALSGALGHTQGDISWPQGLVSDRQGNIWIANCGNDSITYYPGGDPSRARNLLVGAVPPHRDPQIKPFGTVVDAQGNLWVTGNKSNAVYVFAPSGELIDTLQGVYQGRQVLTKPVGNTIDSQGNVWIANSDWLDVPCPTRSDLGPAQHPSVTMYRASDRTPQPGSPFNGGGITLPWGVTVDGDDTVWVLNFGATAPGKHNDPTALNAISRLCGADTSKCPPGMKTGDPISPPTGYQSDALQRMTAGAVDPSGNMWVTNNWKIDVDPFDNPGGNAVVILVGAAPPLKTPVIGPPVPAR
ncbi:MAG: hypothetical protein IT516_12215 [Burkholderiales bacterium]|nr:hypothetical protein [Burkholderiales bacterium]